VVPAAPEPQPALDPRRLAQTHLAQPSDPPPLPREVHSAPADSGHTGPPDPAVAGRVAETERAAALTMHVLGFKCARAHPSDPRSAFCTVCGMPVDQTQPPSDVLRPPLGTLVL